MLSAQAMNMNCFLLLILLLYHRGSTLTWSHYSMCEQKYAIWFANSTLFVDDQTPPPRPRSESCFLIGQNPTPRIVRRLHRWMLPDRTAILIPFDSTCSSGCNFIFMHKMHVKLNKCLKYSTCTFLKYARKSNSWYNGDCVLWKFYEAKRWSHRP